MKVLVVHNFYDSRLPSGENNLVLAEVEALRRSGVEVVTHFRDSAEIADFGLGDQMLLPTRPILSLGDTRTVANLIDEHRPDLMHIHNVYPLISPAIVRVAKRKGVPVVQTVHNYRQFCMSNTCFRDGEICYSCQDKRSRWPGVVHGCYRDSRAQSVIMAASLGAHQKTWPMVDRFLCISEFVAEKLAETGVPRAQLTVKPNGIADPGEPTPPGTGFVFAGRLDREKGVELLIDAWDVANIGRDHTLTIVGDGPLRGFVEMSARQLPGLDFAGQVSRDEVTVHFQKAAVVLVPSVWDETFGLVVVEAFAAGRPVVVTNHGALTELVTPDVGWRVDDSVGALAKALRDAANESQADRGARARERFLERFETSVVLDQQLRIYEDVVRGA